jgi:hypothetical protein
MSASHVGSVNLGYSAPRLLVYKVRLALLPITGCSSVLKIAIPVEPRWPLISRARVDTPIRRFGMAVAKWTAGLRPPGGHHFGVRWLTLVRPLLSALAILAVRADVGRTVGGFRAGYVMHRAVSRALRRACSAR